ncbi:MAG: DoxX family protein [Terriglobales bacterium]
MVRDRGVANWGRGVGIHVTMREETAHQVLRFTLGATAVAAGADKFFDMLTDWEQYLNPAFAEAVGLTPSQFMKIVGMIEIAAGATVLSGRTRFGGWLMSAWLLGITANLISQREFLDIAVRDVNMAVAAYVLARLSKQKRKLQEHSVDLDRAA